MRSAVWDLASGLKYSTEAARDHFAMDAHEISGALVIYCGGCRLALESRMRDTVEHISASLHCKPMLGAFTFGEQGFLVKQRGIQNVHGNLMHSLVVFGI